MLSARQGLQPERFQRTRQVVTGQACAEQFTDGTLIGRRGCGGWARVDGAQIGRGEERGHDVTVHRCERLPADVFPNSGLPASSVK